MKNVYEFKIEDIEEVKAVLKNDKNNYRLVYKRIYENGEPTLQFKESHYALPFTDRYKVYIMCELCGKRNKIDKFKYEKKNFKFKCGRCNNKEKTYSESFVKDFVLKLIKENFDNYDIYINDTYII